MVGKVQFKFGQTSSDICSYMNIGNCLSKETDNSYLLEFLILNLFMYMKSIVCCVAQKGIQ